MTLCLTFRVRPMWPYNNNKDTGGEYGLYISPFNSDKNKSKVKGFQQKILSTETWRLGSQDRLAPPSTSTQYCI